MIECILDMAGLDDCLGRLTQQSRGLAIGEGFPKLSYRYLLPVLALVPALVLVL